MASLLVDTQVLVWLLSNVKQLGIHSRQMLSNYENRVLVSYFSLYEIVVKASIGKLDFDYSAIDDFPSMGLELLQPNLENLRQYQVFNPANKDPFDNMLIATAVTENCAFVSSDAKILASTVKGLKLIDATR